MMGVPDIRDTIASNCRQLTKWQRDRRDERPGLVFGVAWLTLTVIVGFAIGSRIQLLEDIDPFAQWQAGSLLLSIILLVLAYLSTFQKRELSPGRLLICATLLILAIIALLLLLWVTVDPEQTIISILKPTPSVSTVVLLLVSIVFVVVDLIVWRGYHRDRKRRWTLALPASRSLWFSDLPALVFFLTITVFLLRVDTTSAAASGADASEVTTEEVAQKEQLNKAKRLSAFTAGSSAAIMMVCNVVLAMQLIVQRRRCVCDDCAHGSKPDRCPSRHECLNMVVKCTI